MKNTLEYKILEYLLSNDNGDFIDISHLIDNNLLIKNTIRDLSGRKFIKSQEYPGKPIDLPNWIGTTPSEKPPKCKITSLGKEYLYEIGNKTKDFKFKKATIILTVIAICLTLWNVYLQSNQSDLIKDNNHLSNSLDSISKNQKILEDSYDILQFDYSSLLKVVDSLKDVKNQKLSNHK